MLGKIVLGYTVEEQIGVGGFGTVYKVSKTNASGTYVRALKHITIPNQNQYIHVLNSMGGDYSKADDYFAGVLQEIVNEIKIISKLSESGTQNIVRYYENDIISSESPKRYDIYILMEYLTPFTESLYQNELKIKDVIKLSKDILNALISCHSQNIIHRDIKDDNIFISKDGTYKLGDFGVSKILKDSTRAESMKGTPNFIAPEVYLGKEQYDDTVDIYSLGIVLYKLLNKSRNPFLPQFPAMFTSNDEDVAFERRMKGEAPCLPYDAQNAFGEVVVKAISRRENRYNSVIEFLDSIEEVERNLTEEELNRTINLVFTQMNRENNKLLMDETVATDLDYRVYKKNENTIEPDLFKTVSDTYQKTNINKEEANENRINNACSEARLSTDPVNTVNFSKENENKSNVNEFKNKNKSRYKTVLFAIAGISIICALILFMISRFDKEIDINNTTYYFTSEEFLVESNTMEIKPQKIYYEQNSLVMELWLGNGTENTINNIEFQILMRDSLGHEICDIKKKYTLSKPFESMTDRKIKVIVKSPILSNTESDLTNIQWQASVTGD